MSYGVKTSCCVKTNYRHVMLHVTSRLSSNWGLGLGIADWGYGGDLLGAGDRLAKLSQCCNTQKLARSGQLGTGDWGLGILTWRWLYADADAGLSDPDPQTQAQTLWILDVFLRLSVCCLVSWFLGLFAGPFESVCWLV